MAERSPEDTERFIESLVRAQSQLYGFILSLLPHHEAALDVLQETNLVLWRKSGEFDQKREFMPWACRIAHFQVLAHRRDRGRDRKVFSETLVDELSDQVGALLPAQDRRQAALLRCLAKLSSHDRELIESRYAEGGSVEQIAARLNRSVSAASKVLFRIRMVLHACIRQLLAQDAI